MITLSFLLLVVSYRFPIGEQALWFLLWMFLMQYRMKISSDKR